ERLLLKPQAYGVAGSNIRLEEGLAQMTAVLQGAEVPLRPALLWNAGFYLWRLGVVSDIAEGMDKTAARLDQQRVAKYLHELTILAAKG
ncbi:MAG: hypothetical protein Q6K81_08740, partial [Gloeomargarita sp. DG02_5_bins_242]